jgi:hypothetical protein
MIPMWLIYLVCGCLLFEGICRLIAYLEDKRLNKKEHKKDG